MAKKLTKREEDMLTKIDELTQDLQRNQADFENFRRRAEAEQLASVSVGKRAAILELLPALDNVGRAMSHVPEDLADHPYIGGIGGVLKQLDEVLTKFGVTKIATVGEEFNPELMEAVQMEDGDGDKEVVVEELQAGYMLGDEVIRHAMVKVGRQ